jgi:hypothetical protein
LIRQARNEVDMGALIGLIAIVAAAFMFWRLLPRNGRPHPLCNTWMEPYAVVGVMCCAAVGFGLIATWSAG